MHEKPLDVYQLVKSYWNEARCVGMSCRTVEKRVQGEECRRNRANYLRMEM